MGTNSGREIENWRQEIWKCFCSQIQVSCCSNIIAPLQRCRARAHIALFSLNELHRATICQRARLQPFNKTFHVVEKLLRSQCVQNFWQTLVTIMAANWSNGCCKLCRTAVPKNFQQSLVLVQMSDFIIKVNVETTSIKKDARRQGIKIAAEYIFELEKTIS